MFWYKGICVVIIMFWYKGICVGIIMFWYKGICVVIIVSVQRPVTQLYLLLMSLLMKWDDRVIHADNMPACWGCVFSSEGG